MYLHPPNSNLPLELGQTSCFFSQPQKVSWIYIFSPNLVPGGFLESLITKLVSDMQNFDNIPADTNSFKKYPRSGIKVVTLGKRFYTKYLDFYNPWTCHLPYCISYLRVIFSDPKTLVYQFFLRLDKTR